jgi:hypothetical protein
VSTSQALVITVAATLGALACAWQVFRAWRPDDRHDVGPDSLRLLELGPPPADLAEYDRLHTAIHEHREEDSS